RPTPSDLVAQLVWWSRLRRGSLPLPFPPGLIRWRRAYQPPIIHCPTWRSTRDLERVAVLRPLVRESSAKRETRICRLRHRAIRQPFAASIYSHMMSINEQGTSNLAVGRRALLSCRGAHGQPIECRSYTERRSRDGWTEDRTS